MKQHSLAGAQFAKAMRQSLLVEKVTYGLADEDPATKYFQNGFGGMVSIRFKKTVDVKKLIGSMRLVTNVPSLGGTESTATMPTFTTNWFMTAEQKKEHGIDELLVRFSIGLENPDDIITDVIKAAENP
jgi:cystathionine beta-lyase/cystathionine gamma-synthase